MVPKDPADPSKVVLNLQARFFWEDVPFGLVILKDIGRICGVETPNMTKQIIFHQKFMPVNMLTNRLVNLSKNHLLTQVLQADMVSQLWNNWLLQVYLATVLAMTCFSNNIQAQNFEY
jgi:hypothetical protein